MLAIIVALLFALAFMSLAFCAVSLGWDAHRLLRKCDTFIANIKQTSPDNLYYTCVLVVATARRAALLHYIDRNHNLELNHVPVGCDAAYIHGRCAMESFPGAERRM